MSDQQNQQDELKSEATEPDKYTWQEGDIVITKTPSAPDADKSKDGEANNGS